MVEIKTLLPELRNLVGELAEDLVARSTSDAKINAGLKEAFQQIEKGGRTAQAFEVWREDYLDQVAVAWVLACVFVRFMEDILDRTLTPAIAEFGLEKVRMIDPTCGSGHFLLGWFARLFDLWSQRESNEIKAAQ